MMDELLTHLFHQAGLAVASAQDRRFFDWLVVVD